MVKQERQEQGKFTAKSDEPREVRSIRLTATAWNTLGEIASSRGNTRADLIEELVAQRFFENTKESSNGELLSLLEQKDEEISFLALEIERLKGEKSQLVLYYLSDLENMRDQILVSLKVGTLSPLYKKVKKALDGFIKRLIDDPK